MERDKTTVMCWMSFYLCYG